MGQQLTPIRAADKVRVMQTTEMERLQMANKRGTVITTWDEAGVQLCRIQFCGYARTLPASSLMREST